MMWRLLQLADTGFPTGGFTHSAGLEAAVQLGEAPDIARFVTDAVYQAAHAHLPFVRAAHASPADLARHDAHADTFLLGHVANRASRAQGRAFLSTCVRAFELPELAAWDAAVRRNDLRGHLAPLQGCIAQTLGLSLDEALAMALHGIARSLLSAAVRLGRLGPLEAQRLHAGLPFAEAIAITPDAPTQTAPLRELMGQLHDQLPMRLFQS